MNNLKETLSIPTTTMIDVREKTELILDGKVPNAINIPMGEILENVERIKQFSKPIVVFCRSGIRSQKVIDFLSSQNIEDLHNGGGFHDIINALK